MKKVLLVSVLSISLIAFSFSTSFAIPVLQLYIEGATYYGGSDETWITTSNSFRLWVIGNVSGEGGKGSILHVNLTAAYPTSESGSISITPTMTAIVTDLSTPIIPSFVTNGVGTQPIMGDGSSLQPHGIFGLGTSWTQYLIGDFNLTDSPVADLITAFPPYPAGWTSNAGQINAYDILVSGYSWVHFDAFDHYVKNNNGSQYVKAPFSHDAEGGGTVPEPGILILLGIGMTAVGVASRWIRKI